MSTRNQIILQSTLRHLLYSCSVLILSIALTSPSAAQEDCSRATPLPLDQSLHRDVFNKSTSVFRLETQEPGWLTVEVHDPGPKPGLPSVLLLDESCRPLAAARKNLSPGQVAKAVDRGIYYLAVEAGEHLDGGLQIFAWLAPASGAPASLQTAEEKAATADDDDDAGPHEPIDEWDELTGWCPWSGRLELLATFTCARHVQLGGLDDTATVEPLRNGDPEMLALVTTEPGLLGIDRDTVTILDRRGNFVGWVAPGRPIELTAGRWFVRWQGSTTSLTFSLP